MPRQDLVKYEDDDYRVEIVVQQADVEMGLERSRRWITARPLAATRSGLFDKAQVSITYPACLAATVKITNVPGKEGTPPLMLLHKEITAEEWLALPDALASLWQEAAFGLNPHWLPSRPKSEGEEGEAKEPSSETG